MMQAPILTILCMCTLAAVVPSYGGKPTYTYTTLVTPNLYDYVPLEDIGLKLNRGQTSFVFDVRAKNDAHLALHKYAGDTNRDMYEIVIGGWANHQSVIRNKKQGTNFATARNRPLSNTEYRSFWVSWANGVVAVGSGSTVGRNQFMTWTDPRPHTVNFISVSTGWGSTGDWRFDETSLLSTPNNYKYESLEQYGLVHQPGQTSFIFQVRAKNDAHLALHKYAGDTNRDMYEIVIGGWGNNQSVIRNKKQGTNFATARNRPLSNIEYRSFWVSWANGVVAVGSGSTVGLNQFMTWTDPSPHTVNFISVSTGWGSTGDWKFETQ